MTPVGELLSHVVIQGLIMVSFNDQISHRTCSRGDVRVMDKSPVHFMPRRGQLHGFCVAADGLTWLLLA